MGLLDITYGVWTECLSEQRVLRKELETCNILTNLYVLFFFVLSSSYANSLMSGYVFLYMTGFT